MIAFTSLVASLIAALAHRLHFGKQPPRYRTVTHVRSCGIGVCDRPDHLVISRSYARLGQPGDMR